MTVIVSNAWQVFLKGGPMMWPILLLSVVALAIGINRLMFLSLGERKLSRAKKILLDSLRQGHLKETLRLCEENPEMLGRILKPGILKFGSSREVMKGVMEEVLGYEALRIKEHLDILSLIVNLAPLMGLLGTVNAMAVVFHTVVVRSNVLNPLLAGELASGIWQALLTTSAGLAVGILSFTCHAFCSMRVNAMIVDLERSIVEMNNVLQQLAELG